MSLISEERNGETVCVVTELSDIGKAGIKALLYLLRNGESNAYQMTKKAGMGTGNTTAVLRGLHILELVDEKEGRGNENVYFLTEKGKAVAEHLDAAEKILLS